MKRFVKNILAFVLVIGLVAIVADVLVSKGLSKTERGSHYTINALMNQTMNADVVILGNSRAIRSYNTTVLDTILNVDSRNLGVSGQPFGVSYLGWQLYTRRNKYPKLLIINIDYAELTIVYNGFEKEQYYPYICDTLVKPYLDLYGFTWLEKNCPMYRYRGDYKLMSIGLLETFNIHHDAKGDYVKGYSNPNEKWHGHMLTELKKKGTIYGWTDAQAVGLLDEVLQTAEKEGFPVLFVYAPIFKGLKDIVDEKASMEIFYGLAEKYGIHVLDFSDMEFYSDTDYFIDASHVNELGARLFSIELAHAIDSLGLLK